MRHLIIVLIIFGTLVITGANAGQKPLMANAARVDLTPPLDLKFTLGGYGARMSKPAAGIHDRIWAKALVVTDGIRKYAIVTLDILALPPNVKPQVLAHLSDKNWTDANVLLLPSHTHASLDMSALNDKNTLNNPYLGIYQPQLKDFVTKSISEVIEQADKNFQRILIGTNRTTVPGMNRNRRNESATDRELTVTRIDFENGNPLAVLVNWTAHPTLMDENDMLVSGGWPGYLQRELETWIGAGVISMYYNGAQGDQSPIRTAAGSHYEQAEIYGRKLAKKAYQVYQSIQPEANPDFSYNAYRTRLPQPQAHPTFHATGGAEYGITEEGMKIILKVMCPANTTIGAVRLGDLLIVGTPGELTAELGLLIKNELSEMGVTYPVIGGLADEWISYIVTAEQYNKGGYETSVSFYGPDFGDTIVQAMLAAAKPLTKLNE